MMPVRFVLTLSCPDRPGIVAGVCQLLFQRGANIEESQQFDDPVGDLFFMRVYFSGPEGVALDDWRAEFASVATQFDMHWEMWDAAARYRTLIMVSKFGHCLNDLLFRWRSGELNMEIPVIVSNHPDLAPLAAAYDVPFEHIPVTAATKEQAEQRLRELAAEHGIHLIVLARYMQVLSNDLARDWSGRIINIHHSFLPSFKGARPYHQAFERGVKLVGATAHYVTADLDEGPIIEQDVARVDHSMDPATLTAIGRDVESVVLARAVKWHAEHRILTNGSKTVVFR